jgi:hypothetical protein
MRPPVEVEKARQAFQVMPQVGEYDLELLVIVGAQKRTPCILWYMACSMTPADASARNRPSTRPL